MNRKIVWILGLVLLHCSQPIQSDNWPQFRGPQSNQLQGGNNLPQEWSEDKNIKWKIESRGTGWSSPIIWDGKVIITAAVLDKATVNQEVKEENPGGSNRRDDRPNPNPSDATWRLEIQCLDLESGEELWKSVAFEGKPSYRTHRDNTYASETPVTDGELIYVYFGMMGLYCYDFSGDLVWKKDLGVFPMQSNWGTSTSPVLYKDYLYMQIDSEEESFLLTLDAKTGDERWRVSRDEGSNWSTPIIWKNKGRTELVTGGKIVRSYDPQTGELLWKLDAGGGRNISSPVADEEMLYVGNEERRGAGGNLFAVKAGASGDITPAEGDSTSAGVMWVRSGAGLSMASPLLYSEFVFLADRRNGYVHCYDAKTGETAYQKTKVPEAKAFWTSPWGFDGKIFCLDDAGTTHVLKAGGEFKLLRQNKIDDKFWATPALAGGWVVMRGVKNIYCIGS